MIDILKTIKRDFKLIKKSSFNIKLSIFLSALFTVFLFLLFLYRKTPSLGIAIFVFTIFALLLYLVIFDILFLEIPEKFTNAFIIFALVINILVGLLNGFKTNIELTDSNIINNLIGGALGGLIIFSIVFITKEKGMGSGDIKILILLGLLVGFEKVIIAFFLSIYLALIASMPLVIKKKSIHGIQIPFVPFLVFGALVAFCFELDLQNLFFFELFYNGYGI